MKRTLALLAVLSIIVPAPVAAAGSLASACVSQQVSGAIAGENAAAHTATVVVTNTSPVTCTLVGFAVVASGGSVLPTAHRSLRHDVVLAPNARAAFGVSYHPTNQPAPEGQACAIDVQLPGALDPLAPAIRLTPCTSVDRVAVTSYRLGTRAPDEANAAVAKRACVAGDFALRELPVVRGAGNELHTIALMNRSTSACRTSGNVGFNLYDANNHRMAIPIAPRPTVMAMVHSIASGHEVSFTVRFAHPDESPDTCPASARARLGFPGMAQAIVAPLAIAPCPGPESGMHVSLLSDGIPTVL